jgi:hypothetical protein
VKGIFIPSEEVKEDKVDRKEGELDLSAWNEKGAELD